MPVVISSEIAEEKSTIVFQVDFKDENGKEVEPDSVNYTLTDTDGTIINSKDRESIAPASTVFIPLSGNDLKISAGFTDDAEARILTIQAVYDSKYGNDLPLNDQATFYINNLIAIS